MKQFKQFFLILCLTIVGGVSNAWAQTENTVTINNLVYEVAKSNVDGNYAYIKDFSNFDKETLIIPATITVPDAWNGSDVVYEVRGFDIEKDITNNYIRKMIFKGKNSFYKSYNKVVNCPNLQKIFFMTGNWGVAFKYPVGEYQPLDLYFKEVPSMNSDVLPPHPELCTAHVAMNDGDFAVLEQQIADGSIWGWSEFKDVVQWDGVSEINDPIGPNTSTINLSVRECELGGTYYQDGSSKSFKYQSQSNNATTDILTADKNTKFKFYVSTYTTFGYGDFEPRHVYLNGRDIFSEMTPDANGKYWYTIDHVTDDIFLNVEGEGLFSGVYLYQNEGGKFTWTRPDGTPNIVTGHYGYEIYYPQTHTVTLFIQPNPGYRVSEIRIPGYLLSLTQADSFDWVTVDESGNYTVTFGVGGDTRKVPYVYVYIFYEKIYDVNIAFNISRSGGGVAAYSALESTYTAIAENNLSRQIIDETHGDITFSAIANADEKVTFYVNGEAVNPEDVASWVSESDVFVNDGALQTEYKNKTNYQLSYNYEDMIAAGASNGDVLNLNIVTEKIPHIFVNATVEGAGKNTVLCNQNPYIDGGDAGTYVNESNTANVNTFINPATERGSFIGLYATPYKGQTVEVSVNGAELELTKKVADGPLAIPDWNSDWTENNVIPYEEGDTYYQLENFRITPGETYNVKVKYSYQPNYLMNVTRIGGAEVSATRWSKDIVGNKTTYIDDKETLPVELYSECLADEGSQKHLCMELKKNDGEILKLFLDGVDITDQLELSADNNKYIWNFSIPSEQVDTQQHSLVFYSVPAGSADVNGDGAVNIADVTALVNNILGKQ